MLLRTKRSFPQHAIPNIVYINPVRPSSLYQLFPDVASPRPLSHVWDLRATNDFITALYGTDTPPPTASQPSTQSSAAGANILRAQSTAAQAQSQTLQHDKKVWRTGYLRRKKGSGSSQAQTGFERAETWEREEHEQAPQIPGEKDRLDVLNP